MVLCVGLICKLGSSRNRFGWSLKRLCLRCDCSSLVLQLLLLQVSLLQVEL